MPVVQSSALAAAEVLIEVLATAAFALSGVIEAARKRMDAVGVCVVACLAAFGGGTLRDVLLDRRPFFWVQQPAYVWAVLGLAIAAMLFMRRRHWHATERAMLWPDALGLGLFAANGTLVALSAGMPALVATLMGVMTAVFGGVLRDVVCNEVPSAFRDHRPYAVCALAGAWVLVGARWLGIDALTALLTGAATASGLRLLAVRWQWRLPTWEGQDSHFPDSRH